MEEYTKPVVIASCDASEGVYTASGVIRDVATCDSIHMQGHWKKGNSKSKTYIEHFGCQGCNAYTGNGCEVSNRKPDGEYKPNWEDEHLPYDTVNGKKF